jgi:hypothetical protein
MPHKQTFLILHQTDLAWLSPTWRATLILVHKRPITNGSVVLVQIFQTHLNWGTLSVPSVTSSVGFNAISSLANLPSLTGAMGWFNATITNPGITTTTSMNVAGNLLGTTLPLDLSGTNVFMGQFGKLVESGSGILSNGTIMTSSLLNAPNAVNVGNFGLTITSAANLGPTLVQRTHFAWPLGAATGIKRFFRANPASNSGLNATLVFSL